jgi:4-phytase / acid phosphatase
VEIQAKDGLDSGRAGSQADSANQHSKGFACLALVVLASHLGPGSALAQETPRRTIQLKFVVILSRHGVRSPTWSTKQLNQYSAEAWPNWPVPPGNLTPHGRSLIEIFGAYDRAYLAHAGLLSRSGCAEAGRVYFRADRAERTLETGRALARAMLPGCAVEVYSVPEGTDDPLFSPVTAGVGRPDRTLAAAAVSGRIGGNPEALLDLYRPDLETMQQVLLGCKPGTRCPQVGKAVKRSLLQLPASLGPGKGDHLAELHGPVTAASTLAEDFLLEYTNGMSDKEVGWGRVNESNLRQMMGLHTAYSDLLRRTPYIARAQASNLLSHILKTLEQAVSARAVPGALGKPGDHVVAIVGHDTNIANVAGMLGLSWLIEGYQRDDTPPAGALVFELWRSPLEGEYTVRTYYMSQTLEQMRKALPLTLNSPPAKAPVFVPGCSMADEGLPCAWKAFRNTLETAIDPAFVEP